MDQFIATCAAWLSGRPETACREAAQDLRDALAAGSDPERSALPGRPAALGLVGAVLDDGEGSALSTPLRLVLDQVAWRPDPEGTEIARFLAGRSCMSELVGPGSFYDSGRIRFGTFFIGPETVYPLHSHGADELYMIVAGRGDWAVGDLDYRTRGPGAVVHVPSWRPHAIRTRASGVLMLWAWTGDIDFASYRFEPAGFSADGTPL